MTRKRLKSIFFSRVSEIIPHGGVTFKKQSPIRDYLDILDIQKDEWPFKGTVLTYKCLDPVAIEMASAASVVPPGVGPVVGGH